MSIENVWREGIHPALPPNAGHRRRMSWAIADWLAFERDLRAAFPNVFFYEEWSRVKDWPARPKLRIIERLDEPGIEREVCAMFPYPGWEPELAFDDTPGRSWRPFWTWKNYLSPHLRFSVWERDEPTKKAFSATERNRIVSSWGSRELTTSFRKSLPAEGRLVAKVLRMIEKRSRKVVPVDFRSYAEFRDGKGKIAAYAMRWESLYASTAVVEWAKSGPDRLVQFESPVHGSERGWLPPECLSDAHWEGIRRPKWAQR